MKKLIDTFPHSIMESIRMMNTMKLNTPGNAIHNIVVCGAGISGVAANLVEAFLLNELLIPYKVIKGYRIPGFVNKNTLFIANSYSGNTEETLEQLDRAIQKDAFIICISSGGKMEETAKINNLDFVKIPGESKTTRRMSIGYSIILLMSVLSNLELINNKFIQQLLETHQSLQTKSKDMEKQAQKIAAIIKGKFLIMYAGHKLEAIILRAQQQINENAKQLCHINFFPEMNHNEIVSWDDKAGQFIKNSAVILVRTSFEHPRTSHRMEICKRIFKKNASEFVEVYAIGNNFIEQSFYLIHLFDWISYYLALENDVDPIQIDMINYLKEELGKIK